MSLASVLRGNIAARSYRYEGVIGIGTWAWGDLQVWADNRQTEASCAQLYGAARKRGVRLFDTAEIYSAGQSEKILGACLRQERADPAASSESPIVASKFMPWPYIFRPSVLSKHLKASLHRLDLPRLDLYQLHSASLSFRSIETWMHAMADCVDAGLVTHVGISNVGIEGMKKAHETLQRRGYALASNQIEFNLLRTSPESSGLLDACHELGVVPLAYSPLALGALKQRSTPLPAFRRALVAQDDDAVESMRLALLAIATGKAGAFTPAEVALSWVMSKNAVPLVGARTVEHVNSAHKASLLRLTNAEVKLLDSAAAACRVELPWYHYRKYFQES